jgi:hypothetical protein
MPRRTQWPMALLCLLGGMAFAHNAPQSFVKLDFHEHVVHAEVLVPESELEFALAEEQPRESFEAYLLRHVAAESMTGTPWTIAVRAVRRLSYLDHAYLSAAVVMTPPAGSSARRFVLSDDAVTHEVRNHVIVVLANTASAPVILGALQYPAQRLNVEPPAVPRLWTPPAIASGDYESSPSFSPDGREMYFFRADKSFGNYRLMVTRCLKGAWSAPEPPSFASKSPALEADPFVSIDGKQLYFVSSRHKPSKPGEEDLDIFVVARGRGGWGEPVRLPEPVNSPGAELLPRLLADGRLLFGSSREGGHGLGDIYLGTLIDGTWRVENVGPPISTAANEYEAEVSSDGNTMVVVADRGDRSHLYLFQRDRTGWRETGKVPARADVFQVGPLLSPAADRLLFAQAHENLSGELFVFDLKPGDTSQTWPPHCGTPSR